MSSNISVCDRDDSSADSYNEHLLRDIKEVSKALYLNNAPQKPVLSLSPVRSKSVSRHGTTDFGLLANKKKKSLVAWDWKKPLKAIAHFGKRRFDVCFLLHVHSIEGLPSNLDGDKLVVQWKRKDELMSTQPSKVLQGTAEFEETLMYRCSVYGKHGPHHSAKYEMKLFLIYAAPVDAPWLILGKHLIDLTRILPLSIEELEGTRRTRKWNTSFKLSGLADSAVLNLSFDYSVVSDPVGDSSSRTVMLRRVGSVPSLDHRSSQLDDGKIFRQASENLSLDLSQSIDFLYEKLNDQNLKTSTGNGIQCDHLGKTTVDVDRKTDMQEDDSDNTEPALTGKGVEMFQEESTDPVTKSVEIEIIDVHEILKDEEETHFDDQFSKAELKSGASNFLPKHSVLGGPKSDFTSQVISESFEIESSSAAINDYTDKENCLEVKFSYNAANMSTNSLSLDAITESIANDFLNMLELEECSYIYTSDSEPTSPREYLLQEFEKEAFASGNFLLDIDEEAEYVSDIDEESNDFSFSSSSLGVGENKRDGKSQLLANRRKAKILEDLETGTLSREWDLNGNSSENSLCACSDGFGSPIELPVDRGLDMLPLGNNTGPFVWTKGGGCIRSMNPLLFKKCNDASHLIMQVSIPVVLVSELGSDILEILQSLAASRIEGLCSEVNALMPLEDIMGKKIHEVVPIEGGVVQKPSGQLDLFPSKEEYGIELSGYVPIEDLPSLAIDEIELLLVEGLKIHCSMSDQDPPSSIAPKPIDQSKALELLSFSITLDEWLKFDHGVLDNGEQTSKRNKLTLAFQVLLRDPFRNNEPVGASMLALIQVERSLVSSNPPVCSLAQEGKIKESFEYDTHLWRITNIALAGLKTNDGVDHLWCTKSQQQSGSRWLLDSGTSKTIKRQASESKVIIVSNLEATRKSLDTLWSITANRHNQESDLGSSVDSFQFTRNADVIFSNEVT